MDAIFIEIHVQKCARKQNQTINSANKRIYRKLQNQVALII